MKFNLYKKIYINLTLFTLRYWFFTYLVSFLILTIFNITTAYAFYDPETINDVEVKIQESRSCYEEMQYDTYYDYKGRKLVYYPNGIKIYYPDGTINVYTNDKPPILLGSESSSTESSSTESSSSEYSDSDTELLSNNTPSPYITTESVRSSSENADNLLEKYSPEIIYEAFKTHMQKYSPTQEVRASMLFMNTMFPPELLALTKDDLASSDSLINLFQDRLTNSVTNTYNFDLRLYISFRAAISTYNTALILNCVDKVEIIESTYKQIFNRMHESLM